MKKIVLAVLILYCFFSAIPAQAASTNYIRVGLVKNASEQENLAIYSKKIYLGYCKNNSYDKKNGIHLTSKSGFSFLPQTGYFYISKQVFEQYETAKEIASCLNTMDVTAYPAMIGTKEWKIYIGGSTDKQTVENILDTANGKFGLSFGKIQKNNKSRFLLKGDSDTFIIDGKPHSAYPQISSEERNKNKIKTIRLGSTEYRGRIEIGCYKDSDKLTAVNILSIEQYLYGTLPNVINVISPMELLKAQAIITRNNTVYYASFSADSDIKEGYLLEDTKYKQLYSGYSQENEYTTDAINQTKNSLVFHKNKLVPLIACENNGGYQQSSLELWGSDLLHLAVKEDEYTPENTWTIEYTSEQIQKHLEEICPDIGEIQDIQIVSTLDSGRVSSLRIIGENRNLTIENNLVYSLLELNSAFFEISKEEVSPVKYVFSGKGSGSGVGLSLDGAKTMANLGMSCEEILNYYYEDIEIK